MKGTSGAVPAHLAVTLRKQEQVVARRQALAGGMSSSMLRHRLRPGGSWQTLLPGVYLAVTGTPTADQREMAAFLYAGPGSVITGAAALRRQGVKAPSTESVDLLILANRTRTSVSFARVWRTISMPDPVVVIGQRQYAMPARAVADAARSMTSLVEVRALVAVAVQSRRCPLHMLNSELRRGPARGSTPLRLALGEVADGIRSAAEADLRDLLRRGRIPAPLFNPRLYDAEGTFIAVPDAWWPDAGVAAEVDSREWHLSPGDWERTMARHAAMTGHGILLLHFSPQQIRQQPGEIIARVSESLMAGRARPRLPIRALPAED